MKINVFAFFLIAILSPLQHFSQELTISGVVNDANFEPFSYANVILYTVDQPKIVSGTSTDDFGGFTLGNVPAGNYLLEISFVGYKDYTKEIQVVQDMDLGIITLEESAEALNEVSIIVNKPTIKKEADRLVFNIENTAISEGNMMQAVKSTPGVLVMDGTIQVKSSQPTVYINNRKVELTSDELMQLLEGTPADAIKSIEVITNPPASYDASSGVVLNIIMTKNLATGFNGSVYGNYTQGVYPRYQGGANAYFKTAKVNFFANYSYNHDKINRRNDDGVNYLNDNNEVYEAWKSDVDRNGLTKAHNASFNFDYYIDDYNTLSLSSNLLMTPSINTKITNNTQVFDANEIFQSSFLTENQTNDDKYNVGVDLGFVHSFKENGGKLAFNSHVTFYDFQRNQDTDNFYFDSDNNFVAPTAFETESNQQTNIITSQLDYKKPLGATAEFEIGVKFSKVKTESDITRFDFDFTNEEPIFNENYSNAFDYDELVYAAYSNFNKEWEKFSINAGLRMEQTNIEGLSVTTNQTNTQDYLEWFPSLSLKYQSEGNFNLYANYKRSIQRPDFKDLNPFTLFLNDYILVVGNPSLQPIFTDHMVLGTTLTSFFMVEAYYKNMDGNFYEIPIQDNINNTITYTPVNFDNTTEYGLDLISYFNVTDNWFIYAVTSFYRIEDNVSFSMGFQTLNQWSNYSILSNSWSFLSDRSLKADLALTYGSKNLQGLMLSESRLMSDLTISKTFLNKKLVVTLTASDLFNMSDFETSTRYANQYSYYNTNLDNRWVKLGLRYKFGNTKLETNQRQSEVKETERINERD
ncbi:TonB-dependent receptor [Mangrovimonas sp. CR14]|uniref:TonB-dependent receptor domain-containing protein n=1 Tax=Mangrovimonas sp. CR14 TaxID=2706120 RepID=UPI001421989D|nr:outer membrane beta-barrel family protein [Mangrovimonas sp. CR14]NIK90938.1 TonB-dependent receptor [Mangrovimonas sp. CR14]